MSNYSDRILSQFSRTSHSFDNFNLDKLCDIIEEETASNRDNLFHIHLVLNHCRDSLNTYLDLANLQKHIYSSNTFKVLNNAVESTFIDGTVNYISNERFKELSLCTIKESNSLLQGINSLSEHTKLIGRFINTMPIDSQNNLISDPMTLLLELWFRNIQKIDFLKMKVISIFMTAKCLLINFELCLIRSYLNDFYTQISSNSDSYKNDLKQNLESTIVSFNSFIGKVIKKLEIAEINNDKTIFNQCFKVFKEIETMYIQLNFNWLISENTFLNEHNQKLIVNGPSKVQNDPGSRKTADTDSTIQISKRTNSNDNVTLDQLAPHGRSSSISSEDTLMVQSSLIKELPNLLDAFNNARRLESELANVQINKDHSEKRSISISSSTTLTESPILESSSQFENDNNTITPSIKLTSNSHRFDESNYIDFLYSSQLLKNDFSKLMSSLNKQNPHYLSSATFNTAITRNLNGFHSELLNNLYGVGHNRTLHEK
ncbi:hypothetical protein KAFR_0H00770 [Kazachstania africana CBS 2517]|uniref:Uncharacterized protein n=1 Tax=Kazachstania africana (strain ATCC 22294 / BCRC 22015 / CBS 2517 / CECT 1963 / NBRC 1671 / NRRL Y-8276) TaxID=1071382 RepID=H2AYT0_KAZAF|nr:hypothetical protein KAFR_0H00770 [Kazachstania africana CBS 2517]CCF59486.1 hypothetical protein KAFR_0H00770 [Kazachstania africana CBS 2517]